MRLKDSCNIEALSVRWRTMRELAGVNARQHREPSKCDSADAKLPPLCFARWNRLSRKAIGLRIRF